MSGMLFFTPAAGISAVCRLTVYLLNQGQSGALEVTVSCKLFFAAQLCLCSRRKAPGGNDCVQLSARWLLGISDVQSMLTKALFCVSRLSGGGEHAAQEAA